jgi:Domain of unknown function (DUF1902)
VPMYRLVITATWDPEAGVWVAESEQLPIVTEAPTLDDLVAKLPGIIQDVLEENRGSTELASTSHSASEIVSGDDNMAAFELVARVDGNVLVRRGASFPDSTG